MLENGWNQVPNWECLFVNRQKRIILVCVRGRYQVGWKENVEPMWKQLMKNVDLGEPTSFLDNVYLGCTQRECKTNEDIVENYRNLIELRLSAGATEKLLSGKPHVQTVTWSYDVEGHAKKCLERCCELANKTTQQMYKVPHSLS